MTDLLLVPDLGQGPEIWGGVWGYLTAPVEHPPSLVLAPAVGAVYTLDFPSTFGNGRTSRLTDAVDHVVETAQSCKAGDVVAVGHGLGASVLLASLPSWETPPKHLVLVAGVVPREGGSMQGALPLRSGGPLRLSSTIHRLGRRELRLPSSVIFGRLCNGMEAMEVFQYVASFHPLPLRWLGARLYVTAVAQSTSITYVVLERDRLLAPRMQRGYARRVASNEVVSLDACHQAMLERPEELAEIIRQVL